MYVNLKIMMEYLRSIECGSHPFIKIDNSFYCNDPIFFTNSNSLKILHE
jgi:hypothetical protein